MDALDREHARILREAAHGRLPVQEVNHCHGAGRGHPCDSEASQGDAHWDRNNLNPWHPDNIEGERKARAMHPLMSHHLTHAATQLDRRNEQSALKRGQLHNPYALSHYLGAIQNIQKHVAGGLDVHAAIDKETTGRLASTLHTGAKKAAARMQASDSTPKKKKPASTRNFVTDKLILHREAADTLDEEYARILEAWSDAARLASIAARRAKATGQNWRKAGRMAAQAHRGLFGAHPPNWAQQPLGAPDTRRRALKRLNKRTKNATLHTTATEITRDRERRARRFTDMEHPSFPSLKRKVRNFFRRS